MIKSFDRIQDNVWSEKASFVPGACAKYRAQQKKEEGKKKKSKKLMNGLKKQQKMNKKDIYFQTTTKSSIKNERDMQVAWSSCGKGNNIYKKWKQAWATLMY